MVNRRICTEEILIYTHSFLSVQWYFLSESVPKEGYTRSLLCTPLDVHLSSPKLITYPQRGFCCASQYPGIRESFAPDLFSIGTLRATN